MEAPRAQSPEFIFNLPGDDESDLEDTPSHACNGGINTFLQDTHQLEDRPNRPLKKRKLDEAVTGPTSTFGPASKTGFISQHIKEVGTALSKAPVDVVDLTEGWYDLAMNNADAIRSGRCYYASSGR